MSTPVIWQTHEGSLGTFVQGVKIGDPVNGVPAIDLNASGAVSYEIISKKLPNGLTINKETGLITGTPLGQNITQTFSFVVRASNTSGVNGAKILQDRTFTITISNSEAPQLLTPAGYLNIGYNDENYVLNNSTISFQFDASATSIPVGQSLKFYVEEGNSNLPPGLKLTSGGLLYGTVSDDLELDFKTVDGTYDKDFYDMNPYDYGSNIEPATGVVTGVTAGRLTGVNLTYGGYGYLLDPEVIVGGSVNQINITSGGGNYATAPDVVFSPSPTSGGVDAKGYAVLNLTTGAVTSVVITQPGTGYTTAPKLVFKSKDSGSGATATSTLFDGSGAKIVSRVNNGSIVGLELISPGENYTTPPLISFGLPTIGPRILSKTYRFNVTVSNGELTDTKTYAIIVNSEDTLRADTTFISSDSVDYDSSSTYVQAPIWISPRVLPTVKGNNNITIDLEVFDPTPDTGTLVFTLMSVNFDGTASAFGPVNPNATEAFPNNTYLNLDPVGGEITGLVPYQPSITKDYKFTVKVARLIDGEEVVTSFKEFVLTVEGNIESQITYVTPTLIGTLEPNEQSLLKVEATSTLAKTNINYQLIPGYGSSIAQTYVEFTLSERHGHIYIDGYGINPTLILEKGQVYKINVSLINFTASFRTLNNDYYSHGLQHSDSTTGNFAQEKNTGYFLFSVPFDTAERIKITYTNIKTDGLYLNLKQYSSASQSWERVEFKGFFNEYDANTYYENNVNVAYFITPNKTEFTIKQFNTNTLSWDTFDIPTTPSTIPVNGDYWLDLDNSNYGILEYRYISGTTSAGWFAVSPTLVETIPLSGTNGQYIVYNSAGTYSVIRRVNGSWKVIELLKYSDKSTFDPNLFVKPYNKTAPVTNLEYDVWFKYNTPYDGFDDETTVVIKELGNIPSGLALSLDGEVVGKITPESSYIYRSTYKPDTLYFVNDVVNFEDVYYICVTQYISTGNWVNDLNYWSSFRFSTRMLTTIADFGMNDGTTIDTQIRFRVRAKDSQNVSYLDKDFNITFDNSTDKRLTNIYLQPFLSKTSRDVYFNFVTDPDIFVNSYIYRLNDPNFGVQRTPKMLLLGGIESTEAVRYASAVIRNYYDRPLYFGDVKVAIAKNTDGSTEYELVYVEIVDPYEINGVSVQEKIALPFDYDTLTVDYNKIRVDDIETITKYDLEGTAPIGINDVYPSSITLMQKHLETVTLQKTGAFTSVPTENIEDWGFIIDTPDPLLEEDWGLVSERVSTYEDFLLVIERLTKDDRFRPLWMNTSQDGSGIPIGFVKAVPICYAKPGFSDKIVSIINKSGFDFKSLNFTIDRLIIQNPVGETGDKYIKFNNREII